MQKFEQLFIKWIMAEMKRQRKPVKEMIKQLRAAQKIDLANYAEKEAFMVNPFKVKEYGEAFQNELIRVCNATENPQETAMRATEAMKLPPEMLEAIGNHIKKG